MSHSVTMPALGESVTEGTVTRWLKQEGEEVAADEPLLEVSTDKVDTEIPSPAAGVLQKILVGEDETVEVGAELAVIGDGAGGGGDTSGQASGGEQQESGEQAQPEQAEQHLKKALASIPGHPVASNEYGLLLRKAGRFAESRQIYEKSLAAFPEYYPIHKNLGILCDLYLNDSACAAEHYEIYGKAMPKDQQVKLWLADLKTRPGHKIASLKASAGMENGADRRRTE